MPPRLAVQQLEARDTPAATQFADIMPGVWGSYPQNITPSGQTLFFSADNGHGYELYATDGTAAGTRMVKDVRAGLGGSNPTAFFAAGNGIVFFTADDGGGAALWRSNGTAGGTFKAAPLAGVLADGGQETVGWEGNLFYVTRDLSTNRIAWWKTDGTTNTLLKDFGTTLGIGPPISPAIRTTDDAVVLTWQASDGRTVVWQTDGTTAGTRPQQQNLTANGVTLDTGVEISPGRFVFGSTPTNGSTASVWVGDGGNARQLLKAFDATPYNLYVSNLFAVGGKGFFRVDSNSYPKPSDVGLWVTDGTAAGTKKFDLPAGAGNLYAATNYGGTALLATYSQTSLPAYWLSDGTAAGTRPLPVPAGAPTAGWIFAAYVPADGAAPGFFLFQEWQTGRVFRTDGTPGGTAWVDTNGLPPRRPNELPIANAVGDQITMTGATATGAYFNGSIYFPGRTDVQRPELWKWDVVPPAPPVAPPAPPAGPTPTVTGVVVNDGAAQRSMVTKVTVSFDQVVALGTNAVTVVGADGGAVPIAVQAVVVGGKTVATVTFTGPTAIGGSVADGVYTLRVNAAKVWGLNGTAMAADATAGFTRLFGDLDGDRAYNREARWMLHDALGSTAGTPRYDAAFDFNSDGVIDAADELQVVRRWLKTV
ncbi:hypothetical protein [Limnoglobus roseus]|uniref:Uncharacterized protein n=1 Tax=Limnoglobus roseus TaxID=2598579 RepID=A0A5C1ABF5_9BACT|nr:hypothetical protein [Limnoglobus roseus]QEL15503.1 hypothetical protein PX52LOC_02426 [Limnoglobus roseus]